MVNRSIITSFNVLEEGGLFPIWDAGNKIYTYGSGNSYPDIIERLIFSSVTALSSVETAANFIGQLPDEWANMKVNEKESLGDVLLQIAEQVVIFRAFSLHVNLNAKGNITDMRVIPFRKVRLGKMDDDGRIVKAVIKDWSGNEKGNGVEIHLYNADENVIREQMRKEDFRGHLIYHKMDGNKWLYPLSRFHSVIWDMDAEAQASKYKRNSLRKGFFGKIIFITPPFEGNIYADEIEKAKNLNKKKQFVEAIKQFFGVDNVGNVIHLEVDTAEGEIDKVLKIEKIETNIDDRLFEYTEKSARDNIRSAMKNLPEILVRNTDGSLFGVGGETLKEARRFYSKQWERERQIITNVLRKLIKRWEGELPKDITSFDILENI